MSAYELIIDNYTGAISPEQGPNMMWNQKYGMMGGGMMGTLTGWSNGSSSQMTVTPEQAVTDAQHWLDANDPGLTADKEATPFDGYYTLHTLKDGKIVGMLSVNGYTGQVWYHTWHGSFVQSKEAASNR